MLPATASTVERFLDRLGTWLSGLPANPVTNLLTAGLWQIRRTLFPIGDGVGLWGTAACVTSGDCSGQDLTGADLNGQQLSSVNFTGANLTKAVLTGANFSGANLSGANLTGATLAKADFSGADLSGADLRDAVYLDLRDPNGFASDLRRGLSSELLFAKWRVNFTGADLADAKLGPNDPVVRTGWSPAAARWKMGAIYADFTDADLTNASPANALLQHAVFSGAEVTGADFTGVQRGTVVGLPPAEDLLGTSVSIKGTRVTLINKTSSPIMVVVIPGGRAGDPEGETRTLNPQEKAEFTGYNSIGVPDLVDGVSIFDLADVRLRLYSTTTSATGIVAKGELREIVVAGNEFNKAPEAWILANPQDGRNLAFRAGKFTEEWTVKRIGFIPYPDKVGYLTPLQEGQGCACDSFKSVGSGISIADSQLSYISRGDDTNYKNFTIEIFALSPTVTQDYKTAPSLLNCDARRDYKSVPIFEF